MIDVTADEARGLIYVITCEHQHWMLYDTKTEGATATWARSSATSRTR